MQVEVVSPERITFSGEASMVVVRTVGGGDLAFQSRHQPFIGVLQISQAKILNDDGGELFAVHSGFVQCHGDKVTILSDVSEAKDDIDVDRAKAALGRAEDALRADDADEIMVAAKRRAETRLRVAGATTEAAV
ncbi:MAG: ATP synthase F1 subunit epsilon [Acidimicrobiales bacterium]|nr:ATP synthase F1 subunit epsilon [Acidimicrobiia bacterium]NNC79873.1 ATP synthase F1 subunit epsilon [Acidimicrobiales bacterium]RZV47513.1 MAG: ATP synthase F1 subunit epsilon [Acidimicrobiales bacterium]